VVISDERSSILKTGGFVMALHNNGEDQGARNYRGEESEQSKKRRSKKLTSKQERFRIAECNSKGGEYSNGRCSK
jgi:hypothetical protein